jgi:hypothetical protein
VCLPELSYPLCESAGQQRHDLSGVSAVPEIPMFSLWRVHGRLSQRTAKNVMFDVWRDPISIMYPFNSLSFHIQFSKTASWMGLLSKRPIRPEMDWSLLQNRINHSGKRPTMLDQVLKGDPNSGMGLWNDHRCWFCGMALPAPADSNQTIGIEVSVGFIAVAKAPGNPT